MESTPVLVVLLMFSNDSTDMLMPKARLQQNTVSEFTTKWGLHAEKLRRAKLNPMV
jgi:hypothetical protein